MPTNRVNYYDAGNGLLVIWMIIYHIFQYSKIIDNFQNTLFSLFYFFMPFFFYKAGVFWRKKNISDVIKSSYKRFFIPYIVFLVIGHLQWCLNIYLENDYNWQHYFLSPFKAILKFGTVAGNMPLWFIFSLVLVRIIFTFLKQRNIHELVIVISSLILCIFFHNIQFSYPIYIPNICSGIFFFALGHFINNKRPIIPQCIYIILLIIYISIIILYPSQVLMYNNYLVKGSYLLWFLFSICGILLFILCCKTYLYKSNLLCRIGQDSLGYYISHAIIINLITLLNTYLLHIKPSYFLFTLYLSSCIVLLPLIVCYLKKYKII